MAVRNKFQRVSSSIDFTGDAGRTKQSFKNECDINGIMRKFIKTGTVAHLNEHGGQYGFVPSVSFHESLNIVRKAEEMFNELPAVVRKRFGNDPGEFLEFVQDEKNQPEMVKMGLAKAPIVDAIAVQPAPESPAAGDPPPA